MLGEDTCICETKKNPTSRQLLDIEKVMFETDENSNIMGINSCCCENSNECKKCSPIISVDGVYNSISHLEHVEQRNIPFDIVLEPLVVKVIPITAISLIICGVILIIISIFITKKLLPYFSQSKNKKI
ncbi:caveolin-1 protein [Anaeramoeba flamelloides]|uniref:Caveolin-1 protein n=1 Tax=Anaeramoeba flamelloides TaxID=1746091 RepID=A0ABQ8Y6K4_9EUKA|nr:caveolin-1 protein [Anaeramoeba flamelloides]